MSRSVVPRTSAARRGLVVLVAAFAVALHAQRSDAAEPRELAGTTLDYAYDGKDVGHPERAWHGRAYVPPEALAVARPLPLVIFLHGLNKALIKHRWMGGGAEGDVRSIVGELVSSGQVEPVLVAGPSSIVASEVSHGHSFGHLDLDTFVDRTIERLGGTAVVDEARIVVAGHSGAGCSAKGGIASVQKTRRRLLAVFAIDTCMQPDLANVLAGLGSETHVVVGYQTATWTSRPFAAFKAAFERGVQHAPASPGILRVLDLERPARAPHDATVSLTLERWLPKILPGAHAAEAARAAAAK